MSGDRLRAGQHRRGRSLVWPSLVATTLACGGLSAADWPQVRGPLGTGCLPADAPVPATLPSDLAVVWKKPLGDGLAAPIISHGQVIYGELENGQEVFRACALSDGTLRWSDRLGPPHKDAFGSGPRCAAVSDGSSVVLQSCRGELHCLDARTGVLRWRTNYVTDFQAIYTGEKGTTAGGARHGYSGSPCIDGEHVIAQVGGPGAGVVCFSATDGTVVWRAENDQAGYAPVVVTTLAGERQVVCFTVAGVIGLRRSDGQLLWRTPITTSLGRHVMAPVIVDDLVIVGSHEVGLVATRVSATAAGMTATEVWRSGRDLAPNFASAVALAGHLYLLAGNQVVCVNVATGAVCWRQDGLVGGVPARAYAAFIGMSERVLMLNDSGELLLFRADSSAYQEIARVQVCGKTWCQPAYADGMLVLRDAKALHSIALQPQNR
jgi:outer membrane protein assembly factor BamB